MALVEILRTYGPVEAETARAALEGAGFHAEVFDNVAAAGARGGTFCRVMALAEEATDARAFLTRHAPSPLAAPRESPVAAWVLLGPRALRLAWAALRQGRWGEFFKAMFSVGFYALFALLFLSFMARGAAVLFRMAAGAD